MSQPLHAVKRSTREVKALVRERVLPWYKGEGREMGKTQFFRCTHSNMDKYTVVTIHGIVQDVQIYKCLELPY